MYSTWHSFFSTKLSILVLQRSLQLTAQAFVCCPQRLAGIAERLAVSLRQICRDLLCNELYPCHDSLCCACHSFCILWPVQVCTGKHRHSTAQAWW